MNAEERFGPYTVYECIGTGGMATVHRATLDRGDGVVRDVALKRLLPQHVDDKTFVDDFVREGQIASRLHHQAIVSILDLGKVGPTHFIAMELVKGQSMMQLIRAAHVAKRPAPIGVVIALISELCDALDYACNGNDTLGERLNIIHRDLSPSNLLVADDGHLRVIDFGVAKAISGRFATTTGLVKGKLGYMSMEALAGKALDGRADVFSTGVVAWELLTGRRLFTGANEMEIVQRVRSGAVTPPSAMNTACPPTLDSIVQRALSRSRDDRWATAAQFRDALEHVRRAYREDSTVAEVKRWRDAISLEPSPRATRPNLQPMPAPPAPPPQPLPPPPILPTPMMARPTEPRPAPTPPPELRAQPQRPPPSQPPQPAQTMDQLEDADEVTVHRAVPFRVPPGPTARQNTAPAGMQPRRAGTEVELLDLEPPEVPESASGQTAYEARAYEPPEPEREEDALPMGFDFSGDAPSRTYTGQIQPPQTFTGSTPLNGKTLTGFPTGSTNANAWPETATQLNLDAYGAPAYGSPAYGSAAYPSPPEPEAPDPYASAPDGPSGYMDISVMHDEPSITFEPGAMETHPSMHQAEVEDMLDLEAPPPAPVEVEEMLDLEAYEAPQPPRDEFLDLEAEMTNGFDAPTTVPQPHHSQPSQPRHSATHHDTVIVPSSAPKPPTRRKRS